jgi:hypothetical protein
MYINMINKMYVYQGDIEILAYRITNTLSNV